MDSVTDSSAAEGSRRHGWAFRPRGGMRLRIAVSVTVVLLLLILAQSLAMVALYRDLEEEFIAGNLDEQIRYSIDHSRQLGTLLGPQTPNMRLHRFVPGAPLPAGLPPALAALPVGNHEDWSTGRELHVAVRDADGMRYVLVYDEADLLVRENDFLTAIVVGGLLLVALSFVLVYATASRLTRGLETLAARVEDKRDDAPFAQADLDDELLVVARALDRAEARQMALLARERDFNANLSHELRTPLAGMRSDAEMLLADPALPDKGRRRAARIVATADRITALTQSLLMLAREARPLAVEPVNLALAAREAWARLRPADDCAAPTFRIDPEAMVEADATLLQLVLHNLLDNALRHGEGQAIEVAFDGRRLSVCDRGPGFGTDDPRQSFERFRRGGGKPGHGLGLALVAHICAACGWSAAAANRPGGGACLTIDFGAQPGPGTR